MATFTERPRKDGTTSYVAQITRRSHGFTEARTFDKKKTAMAWAKKREAEIDAMIADGLKPKTAKIQRKTLGDAIDKYVAETMRGMGNTKTQVLRTIRKEYDIADKRCDQIDSVEIIKFAKELHKRPDLNSSATVLNYLSHLSTIFTHANALWGFDLDPREMEKAMVAAKHLGLAGRPEERDRRPTMEELDRLMTHFANASAHDSRAIPMHRIVAFAIFSTRRQAEICRIAWKDYEEDAKRVLVRKMKNPGDRAELILGSNCPTPAARSSRQCRRPRRRYFLSTRIRSAAASRRLARRLR